MCVLSTQRNAEKDGDMEGDGLGWPGNKREREHGVFDDCDNRHRNKSEDKMGPVML